MRPCESNLWVLHFRELRLMDVVLNCRDLQWAVYVKASRISTSACQTYRDSWEGRWLPWAQCQRPLRPETTASSLTSSNGDQVSLRWHALHHKCWAAFLMFLGGFEVVCHFRFWYLTFKKFGIFLTLFWYGLTREHRGSLGQGSGSAACWIWTCHLHEYLRVLSNTTPLSPDSYFSMILTELVS